jgi:Mg/Co/Ni transporter MgtE
MYLIQIYTGLVESGVAWEKVKHLGWSKLKELANILAPDNVDAWVALAEQVTVLQLQEQIKEATKGSSAGDSPEAPETADTKTTTMTFKLHEDQKVTIREALDKAKHESGTEHDAVALEAICLDFLGGSSKLKAVPSLKSLMEGKSVEEVLEAFGEVFPDVELTATMEDADGSDEAADESTEGSDD